MPPPATTTTSSGPSRFRATRAEDDARAGPGEDDAAAASDAARGAPRAPDTQGSARRRRGGASGTDREAAARETRRTRGRTTFCEIQVQAARDAVFDIAPAGRECDRRVKKSTSKRLGSSPPPSSASPLAASLKTSARFVVSSVTARDPSDRNGLRSASRGANLSSARTTRRREKVSSPRGKKKSRARDERSRSSSTPANEIVPRRPVFRAPNVRSLREYGHL